MAVSVSVANLKGGVGKSTTCMMLADGLASLGRTVLVVDLDPQGSLSFMLRGGDEMEDIERGDAYNVGDVLFTRDADPRQAFFSAIIRNGSLLSEIEDYRGRVDLIPASPRMRFDELRFEAAAQALSKDPARAGEDIAMRLRVCLEGLHNQYDYILYDCAPNFASMAQGAILASDVIVMPTIADPVAVYGLRAFDVRGLDEHLALGEDIPRLVVITKYTVNHVSMRYADLLRELYPVLNPAIKQSVAMMRASHVPDPTALRNMRGKYADLSQDVRKLAGSLEAYIDSRLGSMPREPSPVA